MSIPLAPHFALDKSQCPLSRKDVYKMRSIPNANVLSSLIYVMISTRLDIRFAMSLLSHLCQIMVMTIWLALQHVLGFLLM